MSELRWDEIDRRAVDTARVLAADAVEKVGNGHPGTAMSLAPAAYLLYQRVMNHDPARHALARSRPVHPLGRPLVADAVRAAVSRRLRSRARRPEVAAHVGLEDARVTRSTATPTAWRSPPVRSARGSPRRWASPTRPATSAACSIRRPPAGESPFDHFIYVIASDGDLQEGITSEASSLAGHQELGNLVVIYDSNQISIEDDTDVAFTEDVAKRYESYGWHVQTVDWKKTGEYVEDAAELYAALEAAKGETSKPSIIILKTIIGWPSPGKQNTGKIHGSALGGDELAATKKVLGWDPDETFVVPDDVLAHTRSPGRARRGGARGVAGGVRRVGGGQPGAQGAVGSCERPRAARGHRRRAARRSSRARTSRPAPRPAPSSTPSPRELPELWGGSADLAESNLTTIKNAQSFIPTEWSTHEWSGDPYGRVLHFGIREHAMGAIVNGIVLHGPTRAFGGTFLIFSDYMRPSVRLASLMNIP